MSKQKKYGGRIENWWKQEFTPEQKQKLDELYGHNLGFVVRGQLGKDYKNRGFDNGPIRTSLVVRFTEHQIETLNTIYDLGDPFEG